MSNINIDVWNFLNIKMKTRVLKLDFDYIQVRKMNEQQYLLPILYYVWIRIPGDSGKHIEGVCKLNSVQ